MGMVGVVNRKITESDCTRPPEDGLEASTACEERVTPPQATASAAASVSTVLFKEWDDITGVLSCN